MLLAKIRNKNNLPIILFFIVLINYIPLILPNIISKESHTADLIYMAISFVISITLLIIAFWKNIDITKEKIEKLKILNIISIILIIAQIINFASKDYKVLDLANIICQFLNICFLFICLIDLKIDENFINKFMKAIIIMGVIACIVNIFLYFKEIFSFIFGSIKYSSIKSFFANRNQFAFFLYISIIANCFLLLKENKKIYKFALILFGLNLFFTMSRTGILVTAIFLILLFFYTSNVNKKTKIIYLTLLLIFGIIIMLVLYYLKPGLIEQLFRITSVKNLSGRTAIWERGINILKESPMNLLFGVGRFKGTEILEFGNRSFTQFHNIYLDFLIIGGILELGFVIYIYSYIFKKIKESSIDIKYKKIYKVAFLTYFIYACFESVGRFSIGAVDTLCFVFFISIPLLYANSMKEIETNKS